MTMVTHFSVSSVPPVCEKGGTAGGPHYSVRSDVQMPESVSSPAGLTSGTDLTSIPSPMECEETPFSLFSVVKGVCDGSVLPETSDPFACAQHFLRSEDSLVPSSFMAASGSHRCEMASSVDDPGSSRRLLRSVVASANRRSQRGGDPDVVSEGGSAVYTRACRAVLRLAMRSFADLFPLEPFPSSEEEELGLAVRTMVLNLGEDVESLDKFRTAFRGAFPGATRLFLQQLSDPRSALCAHTVEKSSQEQGFLMQAFFKSEEGRLSVRTPNPGSTSELGLFGKERVDALQRQRRQMRVLDSEKKRTLLKEKLLNFLSTFSFFLGKRTKNSKRTPLLDVVGVEFASTFFGVYAERIGTSPNRGRSELDRKCFEERLQDLQRFSRTKMSEIAKAFFARKMAEDFLRERGLASL